MIGLSLGPGGMLRPGTFQFSTAPISSLSAAAHTAGRHRLASASSQTCNISACQRGDLAGGRHLSG